MNYHRFSNLFPLIEGVDLAELASDIKSHGLREPITLYDDQILDGRNRHRACELAGVDPRYRQSTSNTEAEALAESVSCNLKRRHLNETQRAMLGARLEPMFAELARERMIEGGKRSGNQGMANLPYPEEGRLARDDSAKAAAISSRSVQSAKKVLNQGIPELIEACDQGSAAVSAAAQLAKAPHDIQRSALETAAGDVTKAVKVARREERRRELAATFDPGDADPSIRIELGTCSDIVPTLSSIGLVHADPPWEYSNQRLHGTSDGHYSLEGMGAIVSDLNAAYAVAAPHCYLLCWCTFPLLSEWFGSSPDLEWTYKSAGSWVKEGGRPGIGFHWRGRSEALLLYTKGNPGPFEMVGNAHVSQKQEHSEKPIDWLRDLVSAFGPSGGTVLDLYAGRAPLARACQSLDRSYVGIEVDKHRRREGLHELSISGATEDRPKGRGSIHPLVRPKGLQG